MQRGLDLISAAGEKGVGEHGSLIAERARALPTMHVRPGGQVVRVQDLASVRDGAAVLPQSA